MKRSHGAWPRAISPPPPIIRLTADGVCALVNSCKYKTAVTHSSLWGPRLIGRAYPEGGGSHTLEGLPGAERVVAFLKILQYVVFLLQASSNSPPLCAGCAIKSLASKSPLLLLFHSTCTL